MTRQSEIEKGLNALAQAPDAPEHFRKLLITLFTQIEEYSDREDVTPHHVNSIGLSVAASCINLSLNMEETITLEDAHARTVDTCTEIYEAVCERILSPQTKGKN